MMGSDLPFDGEDDDQYPEGKLPLLSAEEPSTDSEEVVFNKSQVKSRDENSSLHADQDQMVTVNLSEDEPGEFLSVELDLLGNYWLVN